MSEMRKRRANGEASRARILDAAAEIAGERGYEGTAINLVSGRSGLSASSIYWHFKDKDQLIAAVIDRSFNRWVEAITAPVEVPPDASPDRVFHLGWQRTGAAIAEFPDYLRLGLMLILEQRPEEPSARRKFLEVRHVAQARARALYRGVFADLDAEQIDQLVLITLALSDGFFVAQEAGEIELAGGFDLLATAILGAAREMRAGRG